MLLKGSSAGEGNEAKSSMSEEKIIASSLIGLSSSVCASHNKPIQLDNIIKL